MKNFARAAVIDSVGWKTRSVEKMWYNDDMTPKITDEQRQAILACQGNPIDVEDEQTHTRYVLVDHETHQRAIAALRQQEDIAAIQQGLDAAADGRESTLQEADAHIRKELGFPSRK